MLIITNVEKIDNCIGYNMWTIVSDTHYSFCVDVNGNLVNITLSRYKIKDLYGTGHPHPHKDRYLLMCNNIPTETIQYWLDTSDIGDMWSITRIIENIINEVTCSQQKT